jgi:hypothetical protein
MARRRAGSSATTRPTTATSSDPRQRQLWADDNSPAFVARAMNAIGSIFIDIDKVASAFRR